MSTARNTAVGANGGSFGVPGAAISRPTSWPKVTGGNPALVFKILLHLRQFVLPTFGIGGVASPPRKEGNSNDFAQFGHLVPPPFSLKKLFSEQFGQRKPEPPAV